MLEGCSIALSVVDIVPDMFKVASALSNTIEVQLANTVTVPETDLLPQLAVIVVVPGDLAVTLPSTTVAIDGLRDDHVIGYVVLLGIVVALSVVVADPVISKVNAYLSKVIESQVIGIATLTVMSSLKSPHIAEITQFPVPTEVIIPSCDTVATFSLDDTHIISSVVLIGVTVAFLIKLTPAAVKEISPPLISIPVQLITDLIRILSKCTPQIAFILNVPVLFT